MPPLARQQLAVDPAAVGTGQEGDDRCDIAQPSCCFALRDATPDEFLGREPLLANRVVGYHWRSTCGFFLE
jgi:hypothetical protein